MNLYIFNESTRGAVYGIGTYIHELTASLRHSNMNVCVVNLGSSNHEIQIEETGGITYYSFPAPTSLKQTLVRKKISKLYYKNVVYLLQLYIEDKKELIFHCNFINNDELAVELKKTFDCKLITTIHYFDWCFKLSGNITRFRKLLASECTDVDDSLVKEICELYWKEKAFFESLDHIICLSENTQQILQNDYQINPNKTAVIYNGLTDINLIPDIPTLRKKYHIPDIPIILFAGRIDDIKGLTYALRAFRIVLNTQPHCHFIIAGNGSFETYMKECEDIWMHVTWTGLIDKNRLYDFYSIADVGVMPSFHEQCS